MGMISINIVDYDSRYLGDVRRLAELVFKGKRDAYWASRWVEKCDKAFLAFVGGELVGVVELGYIRLSEGLHSQIGYIFVHPLYRRRGVASRLIEVSLKFLANQGVVGVWAVTGRDNHAAIGLFEKNGFKRFNTPRELEGFLSRRDIKRLLWRLYYEEGDVIFYKQIS